MRFPLRDKPLRDVQGGCQRSLRHPRIKPGSTDFVADVHGEKVMRAEWTRGNQMGLRERITHGNHASMSNPIDLLRAQRGLRAKIAKALGVTPAAVIK